MDVSGITWKGESIEDAEISRELRAELVRVLSDTNGFILHGGAVPSEKVSSRRPRRLCLGKALMGLRDVRRISVFVLTLALPPGERGRLARCLWPPAKGVCYRGVMLQLIVCSRLRTIRRDAEWCDRDGRAPQIESSASCVRETLLDRRKAANFAKTEMRGQHVETWKYRLKRRNFRVILPCHERLGIE